jgi:hypothetical protein
LTIKERKNGTWIAIEKVPVMYRLLEKSGQPTNEQTPGKSIRQRSGPARGRPARIACERRGGDNHRP